VLHALCHCNEFEKSDRPAVLGRKYHRLRVRSAARRTDVLRGLRRQHAPVCAERAPGCTARGNRRSAYCLLVVESPPALTGLVGTGRPGKGLTRV
jgi:hypothetical protein